ncbi:MAG: glycosyltransferase [Actinomycetota bacterium]|nr:glycosyltransferase [Actinomycetota bacterium]
MTAHPPLTRGLREVPPPRPTGPLATGLSSQFKVRMGRLPAVLVGLLLVDAFFLLLHIPQVIDLTDAIHRLPAWAERVIFRREWWLGQEGGYAEWSGYAKSALAVVLLLVLYRRRRQPIELAWAATFLVIALDDALALHERGGIGLAESLGLPDVVIDAEHLGELVIWGLLAGPLLALLLAWRPRSDAGSKRLSKGLALLVAILVVLAVVLDAVQIILTGPAAPIVGTIEDGGEMVVMSLVVVWLLAAVVDDRRDRKTRAGRALTERPGVTTAAVSVLEPSHPPLDPSPRLPLADAVVGHPVAGTMRGRASLDVVICTFNNAAMLDRVLAALAAQRPAAGEWGALVVDNNSDDETQDVVSRHMEARTIADLRQVRETTQGLTPARLRGVESTTAPWIAFVDDDCVLDQGWVAAAIDFAASHPDCAGFGGRVVPTYIEAAPPVLARYGWAFAEQDLGDEPVQVDCLVGAGMVVRRAALQESGWTAGPFFADRVGKKLVSGGDVEIALRLAGTGRPLWYTPTCSLRHLIAGHRTSMPYLLRMTRSLGVSHSLAHALTWRAPRRAWARAVARDLAASALTVLRRMRSLVAAGESRQDAMLAISYEWGRWQGMARVAVLLAAGRCQFFGGDRPRSPDQVTGAPLCPTRSSTSS